VETGLTECQRPSTGSHLRASLCLSELFVLITRHTIPCLQEKGEKPAPPAVPSLLQDAVFLIRSDYARPLTVQSIAKRLRVTPQHLIRVFQKCLKLSPLQYIHSVRMEQAREMLRVSRLSIKEICLASGFRDRHHFTRLFAKIHGCPPNTYRETGRRIG
jgi:transcriptional regulator GlxA family with amidase domain